MTNKRERLEWADVWFPGPWAEPLLEPACDAELTGPGAEASLKVRIGVNKEFTFPDIVMCSKTP